MICTKCGYDNKPGVRYCQRCGQYNEPKWTLAQEVRAWDFRGLAGAGRRDVNVAPLFTAPASAAAPQKPRAASPVDPLPDGRWYCPDCGTLNTPAAMSCKNCGKTR